MNGPNTIRTRIIESGRSGYTCRNVEITESALYFDANNMGNYSFEQYDKVVTENFKKPFLDSFIIVENASRDAYEILVRNKDASRNVVLGIVLKGVDEGIEDVKVREKVLQLINDIRAKGFMYMRDDRCWFVFKGAYLELHADDIESVRKKFHLVTYDTEEKRSEIFIKDQEHASYSVTVAGEVDPTKLLEDFKKFIAL